MILEKPKYGLKLRGDYIIIKNEDGTEIIRSPNFVRIIEILKKLNYGTIQPSEIL